MDVLLWGQMPVPACRERFDLLHDAIEKVGNALRTRGITSLTSGMGRLPCLSIATVI